MSSIFTNEPSGTSVLLDWPFNTPAGNGLIDFYGNGRIVADSTAPVSPSNVLQQYMPAGSSAGGAQMDFFPNTPTGVGDIITYSRSIADYPSMYAAIFSIILLAVIFLNLLEKLENVLFEGNNRGYATD